MLNVETENKVTQKIKVLDYIDAFRNLFKSIHQYKNDHSEALSQSLEQMNLAFKHLYQNIQIIKWTFDIPNHESCMQNIYKALSKILHIDVPTLKSMSSNVINSALDKQKNILPIASYKKEINHFIDNPKQITLSINPAEKITMDQYNQLLKEFISLQETPEEGSKTAINRFKTLYSFKQDFKRLNVQLQSK